MNIAIASHQRTRRINLRLLKIIARELLAELELEKAEIGICFVAAPEMTRLNETFLKHKGSTDVIAFDYGDISNLGGQRFVAAPKLRALTKQCPPGIHGEIFICVDEAILQARKFGTSWQSEVVRYIIHGVLHLAGFDDHHPKDTARMRSMEEKILK